MPHSIWTGNDASPSPLRAFQSCPRISRRSHEELLAALRPDLDTTRLSAQEKDALFETELFTMNDFYHREYGVPTHLSELHITKEQLPAVAKQARYDGAALYNKYKITEEVALEILEAAL